MKTIAAVIAGLLLSFMTFVGGVMTSSIYFDTDNPHHRLEGKDATALWTSRPVAVNRDRQSLKRVPARPAPAEKQVAMADRAVTSQMPKNAAVSNAEPVADDDPQPMVDPVTTGAIDPVPSETKADPKAGQNTAHVEWCSRHYRSYQAADNTYRSYSGDRRTCESPHSGDVATNVKQDDTQEPEAKIISDDSTAQTQEASFERTADAGDTTDHVQSCLRRYRSYRLEDNSYQPFDGGPRRQCQ
jgi:hypothetical protein